MKKIKILGMAVLCAAVMSFAGCSSGDEDTAPEVFPAERQKLKLMQTVKQAVFPRSRDHITSYTGMWIWHPVPRQILP